MTANVTIQEFYSLPDRNGDVPRKADNKTTITTAQTHTNSDITRYVIVSVSGDCRVSWDGVAAVDSDENLSSSSPNYFVLAPGTGRTMKFFI